MKQGSMFFPEKKNQFILFAGPLARAQVGKSLFASFSSEKEDS
jgi:hypothetical protein